MATARRVTRRARPDDWAWLRDLVSYWPVLVATLTIVAFILNAQRDIADLKLQVAQVGQQVQGDAAAIQSMRLTTDTIKADAHFRDYVLCQLLLTMHPKEPLPQRCEAVGDGWGIQR